MRSSFLLRCLILAMFCGLTAHSAFARTEEEIRTAIEETLMQRHPTDNAEWWRALGASAPRVIISMYESTSHVGHRVKLLQGISAFDTPETIEFLKKQAQATPDDVVRNTAVKGVGAAAGARETEFLSRYLHHEDPQTRLTAAQALAILDDPRARALVDQFKREEKTPWVVARLNGQTLGATGTLKPVTTSEDRLSPELSGEWTGLWIGPQKAGKKGVQSQTLILRLRGTGATDLKGDVVLSSLRSGRSRLGEVAQVLGKASAFSGVIVLKAQGKDPKAEIPFEAQLQNEGDALMLILHVRKLGVWAVLKKSP